MYYFCKDLYSLAQSVPEHPHVHGGVPTGPAKCRLGAAVDCSTQPSRPHSRWPARTHQVSSNNSHSHSHSHSHNHNNNNNNNSIRNSNNNIILEIVKIVVEPKLLID